MKNNQQDDPNDSNKENSSTGNEENKSSDTKPSATGSKNNSNATTIIHSAIDRLLGISVEAIIEAQERNRQILATPDRFFNINTNQGNNIPGRALETPEFGMNTFREYIEDLGPGESLHFFTLERGHVVHYRLNRSENHVVQLYSPLRDSTSYTHLSESRIWPPYVKWDFFDIVPITFVRRFTREEEEQVKFKMVPFQDMEAAFHHETPKLSSSVSCTDLTHEALEKLDERMSVPPVMKSLPLVDPPTLPFKSKVIAPSPHLRNIFVYQNFGRIRSNSWSASDSDSVQPESSSFARRNPDHLPPAHMRMVEWPPAEEGVVPRIVTVTLNRAYMSVSRRVQGTVSPSPGVGEVPRDILFPVQEEQEGEVRVERNEEAGETIENSPQAMEEENVEAQPQEEQMAVSIEPEAGPSVPLVEPEPVKSPRKRSYPDSKPTSAAGASSTQALQPRIPGSLASPPEVNLYGKPSTSSSQQSLPPAPAVEQPEAEEEEPSRRVSAPARMVNNSVAIRIDARPRPGPNPAIGLLNYVNPLSLGPAQGYPASLGVTNNIGNMSTFDTLFNRSVGALCLAVREDEPEASTSADEARIPLAEMNLNAPEGPSVSPPSRPESGNISDISTPEVVTMANAFLLNNPLPPLISPLSSNTTNSGSTFSLSSSRRSSNDESSSNEAYVIRYANGERVRRTGAYVPTPPALNQTGAEGLPATRTSSRVQSDEYRILTNAEAFNGANYLLLLSLQQLSTVRSVYDLNGIIFALVCAQDFLFYHCTDASEDVMLTLEFLRTLQINQSEDLLAEVRRKVNDLLAPHTWRRQLMQFQHQRCIRDRGYDADGLALQELPELPILPEEIPAARDEEGSEREALQVPPVASGSQDDDDDPSPSKRARKTEASDGDNIDED